MITHTNRHPSNPGREIEKLLTTKLFVRPALFSTDKEFFEDLQLTHYDFLELINYLEDQFGIDLRDEDLRHVRTADDLSQLVRSSIFPSKTGIRSSGGKSGRASES